MLWIGGDGFEVLPVWITSEMYTDLYTLGFNI